MAEKRYESQVRFLLRILPHVAEEECFALKGGTAINLFVRDLPRLSVDIDLTYTPKQDRDTSLKSIAAALGRVRDRLQLAMPEISLPATTEAGQETKLVCILGPANVKIEVNTTLRGTLWPIREMDIVDCVQEEYGTFVAIQVVSNAELFGGKIAASLDRQHPRDLFDIHQLFLHEGLTEEIIHGFVVALVSHNRPLHELLRPNLLDQRKTFKTQFEGMTRIPFTHDEFEATRKQLIMELHDRLSEKDKSFLTSFASGEPNWGLAPVDGIDLLPAVQWKLTNLNKLKVTNPRKHTEQLESLRLIFA